VREDLDGRGGLAPWRDWVYGADVLEAGHLGEACTTYHGDVDGPYGRKVSIAGLRWGKGRRIEAYGRRSLVRNPL
jgi:hypothetical protein